MRERLPAAGLPRGVKEVAEDDAPKSVLAVKTPNELIATIGWLKMREQQGMVLMRGESAAYPDMRPTGFRPAGRDLSSDAKLERWSNHYNKIIADYLEAICGSPCSCRRGGYRFADSHMCDELVSPVGAIIRSTRRAVVEPLLQHYGIRTRWIDLVDNVWTALWFACHEIQVAGRYAYYVRRSLNVRASDEQYAYICVMRTGARVQEPFNGYFLTRDVRVVDLRYCVPSVYLRPHAQHGYLMAPRGLGDGHGASLMSQVVCYVKIPLGDALNWLGEGAMISQNTMFPPPVDDIGYELLLRKAPEPPLELGHLMIYGPGVG